MFLLLTLFSPHLVSAQELFSDDFSSATRSAELWSSYVPLTSSGSWKVDSGEYVGTGPKDIYGNSLNHYSLAGDKSWTNYRFEVKVKAETAIDKIIFFRCNVINSCYTINIRSYYPDDGNDIQLNLDSNIQAGGPVYLDHINFTNYINTWYKVAIEVRNLPNGDISIKVYIDNTFIFEHVIPVVNSPIYNGNIGFGIWPGGATGIAIIRFDDVVVTALDSSIPCPNCLPVPDLKQNDSRWGTQEYDNAHKWAAANPTISRWGCALTSAVMAMRYHGFIDVRPDILNNWLKATPGGYTRNGGVNWLAIARYTKLFPNSSGESLEYKFFKDNLLYFSTLIDENMVPIVNFPSHFLIAKGYTNQPDYLINDPASDLTTLSAAITKWGNVKKIAYYQPSKSNLSYLYFVADPNVNLNLFNSSGNQVSMEYLLSAPLTDDIDPTIHGPGPFGEYYLSQPPIDKYKLEITGNGPYSVDSYFYDIEGNVRIATINGTITANNNIDKYTLTYNYENPTIKKDDIIIINVLIKDIENAHKQKLIPSYLYYLELKSQAVLAKMLINKKQLKDAKVVLRLMKFSLSITGPKLIKPEAKQILLNDVNSLISSLP